MACIWNRRLQRGLIKFGFFYSSMWQVLICLKMGYFSPKAIETRCFENVFLLFTILNNIYQFEIHTWKNNEQRQQPYVSIFVLVFVFLSNFNMFLVDLCFMPLHYSHIHSYCYWICTFFFKFYLFPWGGLKIRLLSKFFFFWHFFQ